MSRKDRITEVGYYHIINRGVERRMVFLEPEDYDKFLDLLLDMKKAYSITIHAYCLMTNHYHILLETTHPNISEAVKYLNSFYSMYFNKKYTRSGHLWQGRFLSYYLCKKVSGTKTKLLSYKRCQKRCQAPKLNFFKKRCQALFQKVSSKGVRHQN